MIKSFKNLIGDEKKYLAKKIAPDKEAVFCVFREIIQDYFGKVGSKKMTPDFFSNDTLLVKVPDPAWSVELGVNIKNIVHEMNKKLGKVFVREIKIK